MRCLDAVIFGGGAAGLWLLEELVRRRHRVVLLEGSELGSGQTIASQGIIHGGVKYTLGGLLTSSARAIRDMPDTWRHCLAGEQEPDLRGTRMRSEFCFLWRTRSLSSRLSMMGARVGLQVAPTTIDADARPGVLAACPGDVARLDEQVIEPGSFLERLSARRRGHLLSIDPAAGIEMICKGPGEVETIRLICPQRGDPLELHPGVVILTAGGGNQALLEAVGLPRERMQRRPLHMVMVRGDLPVLNGHCVDGGATRLTITTTRDIEDRVVWQVGGQIAEDGVGMDPESLVRHASRELAAVLPDVDLSGAEWSTYRVDRAEGRTAAGRRPETPVVQHERGTIAAWPTKLALVPELVRQVVAQLEDLPVSDPPWDPNDIDVLRSWPRPSVALPPWECQEHWWPSV
ncbi:MAG: FAD-dependent oxidoreductase [Planctomycetota bacterium]